MNEGLALSRHALARRQNALADMRRYLTIQEQDFQLLRATLLQFMHRYQGELGSLYQELEHVEGQLQRIVLGLGGTDIAPPPKIAHAAMPALASPLPPPPGLPPEPAASGAPGEPPSLKQLYRRAAMRLHPDRVLGEPDRQRSLVSMMAVNDAYAREDRQALENLLIAAGEDAVRVTGENMQPRLDWLRRAEHIVQERLGVVQLRQRQLQEHPLNRLWQAVSKAETKGLRPLTVMANRLRTQISERRRELYIGQRLQPGTALAQSFLSERRTRLEA